MDWLAAVQRLRAEGRPGVLVTVVEVRGHAPRDAGAKMVVSVDGSWGSVGGGNLEETAIDRARTVITDGARAPEMIEVRLNEHARNTYGRQCCGGVVRLLLEPLPIWPTVAIFGLGHVGHELARILSRLEIRLHLVDSRAEQLDPLRLAYLTEGAAEISAHTTVLGETVLERLPIGAHVLIMTHDHAEDFALCDAALRRGDLGSIGLIGSSAKWARFRRNLAAEGHEESAIDTITCPIGSPDVVGKEPAVIAIGVAAALLELINGERSVSASARAVSLSNRPSTGSGHGPSTLRPAQDRRSSGHK
jgi:xanthine dehydrogenase accessory factor